MQRGEVWRYDPVVPRPGQSVLRVLLSVDAFNTDPGQVVVMGAHVLDRDRGGLLNVRTSFGWVALATLEPVMRRRLVEQVGTLDPDEIAAVLGAFRALHRARNHGASGAGPPPGGRRISGHAPAGSSQRRRGGSRRAPEGVTGAPGTASPRSPAREDDKGRSSGQPGYPSSTAHNARCRH